MMYEENLVSIIVLRKDTPEDQYRAALESAINQSWKDTEIVFIEDGSREEISADLKEKCEIYIKHEESQGIPKSRNEGLNLAHGEFIVFLDSDDTMELDAVETMVNYARREDSEITLFANRDIFTNYWAYNGCWQNEKRFDRTETEKLPELLLTRTISCGDIDELPDKYPSIALCISYSTPWGKLYNHEFLTINNIAFDERCAYQEDVLFNLQCYIRANKIYYNPTVVYNYSMEHSGDFYKKTIKTDVNKFKPWLTSEIAVDEFLLSIEELQNKSFFVKAFLTRTLFVVGIVYDYIKNHLSDISEDLQILIDSYMKIPLVNKGANIYFRSLRSDGIVDANILKVAFKEILG